MRIISVLILLSVLLRAENFIDVSVLKNSAIEQQYLYLEDQNATLTLDALLDEKVQKKFHPLNGRSAGFGLTRSDFWIKISLKNPQKYPLKRLLKFEYPLLDHVTFYQIKADGTYSSKVSGDSIPLELHEKKDENIIFPIVMQPDSKETFYVHIRSKSSMDLRVSLLNDEEYYVSEITKMAILGIFYGGAIIMILYNFFLFLSIRERSYLYYVIFQISNVITLLALSGIAFRYLWPSVPELNNYIIPFLIVLLHVLAVIFSRTYLDTKTVLPKLDKGLYGVLLFSIPTLFLTLVLDYHWGVMLATGVLFITTFSLGSVGLIAYFRYNVRASKFYMLAWVLLLIGATLTGLKNIGLLPINFLTIWGTQIGVFFELLLLSFGLADRINVIRLQKERFQYEAAQKAKALTEILRRSKDELELEVKERTVELYETNQQLHKTISTKEALIKEVHHRVKNNLQVIISMMWLQRRRTPNEEVRILIDDSTARLQSMAMIHEMLYQSDDIAMVSLQEYLRSLINLYQRNMSGTEVKIVSEFQPIQITMDTAVTVGMICNEVLSNVFKHAFKPTDTGNRLMVKCAQNGNKITLRFKDNGIGFEGFSQNKKNIGIMLIQALAEKLPEVQIVYKKWYGTYFKLEFLNESNIPNR
ncbi:7TM diverse intracellular signaling domain-containing protein [Sulfuricurvum sp.]|uniref:7TM diverse intracellular signaling domain-containing protein n=1 Tax=Sulfuricurvum sp. TaxID=2025608 RepID=UPI002E2EDD96|nr:7TM diverse intracellular signaling domain-containing protein [Sulfuricurvum sp.]HEX5328752.1 7TM diverse intracellular signaling domain-containing protein [Sulfuricurvum sp.]